MLIRDENAADVDAIRDLTRAAFEPMPFSSNTEARIVDDLRASGDLTISLVAEEHGEVVGHVAFSPVAVDGVHGGWFGLGPISVKPDRQRQGIGKALILRGLDLLRERGAAGCALVGSPEIYGRVGFESDGRLRYADIDPKFVQRIVLRGEAPSGILKFAPAFEQ
ncbi:putative acetyltransferase [Xaviernesmea oryzae]|uniref:Putative acetyltransferase n=1 Tax=Xaviernesmea oryzae TaxID=464029 RepID=A0A1X7CY04_9HYPH|nr:N-acetyltransferase [Xaviernesmea oryzae]SMF04700.1 putative acetyltransferase [Xaviernesmea oryzae]